MSTDRGRLRPVDGVEEGNRTEEGLLVEVAQGDQAAFAALYDRTAGLVHGVVTRVLRDPAQSEEVTQEIFVEVWSTAPRYDPQRGSARTWILTMAHRRAIDRVRSEQAWRERTAKVAHNERSRAFNEVVEEAESREEQQRIRDALAVLTDIERQAVELAYYQGYTYREVAELLDTPLGTIKTRMRDGLIRLRSAMGVIT